jgi:hypothetical protein
VPDSLPAPFALSCRRDREAECQAGADFGQRTVVDPPTAQTDIDRERRQ